MSEAHPQKSPWWMLDPVALLSLIAMTIALGAAIRFAPDFQPGSAPGPATAREHAEPQIQDFAFLLNYARGQFADRMQSPYAVDTHRRFMARWLGKEQDWAMCFGWSPMAIPVMAPLFPLPTPAAWAAFCVLSSVLFLLAAGRVAPPSRGGRLVLRLAVASPCAIFIIGNGQTSLLTTAALVAGIHFLRPACRGAWMDAALGVALGLLAFKPPIAILAGVALLATGRFRPIWIGAGIVGAVVAATTIWFGPRWITDYAGLLGKYDTESCDPIFRAGFVPLMMSNLRSVLLVAGAPDGLASRISSIAFLAGGAAIALAPLIARRPLTTRTAIGSAVIAYCLFSPHLSPSEDLAMIIPIWIALENGASQQGHVRAVIGCLLIFFFGGATSWLIPGDAMQAFFPLAAFVGKLLIAAAFMESAFKTGRETERAAPGPVA